MQIWILMKGELSEGGEVLDVFADRDVARGRFLTEALTIDRTFGIRDAHLEVDGSLRIEGGCDWLSLTPHDVITRNQLTCSAVAGAR